MVLGAGLIWLCLSLLKPFLREILFKFLTTVNIGAISLIEDIIEGVLRTLDRPAPVNINWDGNNPDPGTSLAPWRIYNIGNSQPVELLDYIDAIEQSLGIKAIKELLPMQLGDVPDTHANVDSLIEEFDYKPSTTIQDGIQHFVTWYRKYYKV